MSSSVLHKLFLTQAYAITQETAELLSDARDGKEFFRRVHDLKALAHAADATKAAQELHQLEDFLWDKLADPDSLKFAQKKLEAWFLRSNIAVEALTLEAVFSVLADEVCRLGESLGKTLQIAIEMDDEAETFPLAVYPAYLHLLNNALTHGTRKAGFICMRALHEPGGLSLEVEDDGGETRETKKKVTMLSGRGAGLDSIRSHMERVHGRFESERTESGGTRARLFVPHSQLKNRLAS